MNAIDLSNEELANILNAMCITGICPSRDEKEYLKEAANRLITCEERNMNSESALERYRFYCNNKDFKLYVDKCAKTYNKTINEVLESPITEEYYLLLLEKEKVNKDENK